MKKLFFALISLLLFASNVFADCEILLQKDAQTIELGDTWSKDINEEGYTKVDFMIARSKIWGISTGKVIVYIYDNDGNKLATKEIKNDDIPLKDNYSSYSIESNGTSIRRISIEFPWGGGGKKHVKEVYAKKKPRLAIPTAPINFVNGANEQTINIDYSALTSDLTAELETKDEIITLGSPYGTSTSSVAIAYAGCTNGTVGLKVSYNPINCNDYTNKIIFKQNGTTVATINVNSTYNRNVHVNTDDINFTDIKPGEESKKVIGIDYAYQSENVIATLEKTDSPFSLSTAIVAKGDCSVGEIPLTLTYNPTDCKEHTNKIIFTQGGKTIATINVGSTYNRYVNMKTDDISFLPTMELGTQKTISVDVSYAFISENLTATLENADSPFSLSTPTAASANSVIVAENNCTVGETTLTITFDPKKVGPYTNVIKLSNGSSINISGECSKKIDTKLEVLKESYTSVSLGWTKVNEATAYRIIENNTNVSYIVEGNVTSYNFRGLQTNTSYSFTLYALFDGVVSLNSSNIVTAKTLKTDAPIQDCIVYENSDEKWFMASTEENITYDLKTGNSESLAYTKRVEFEARMEDALFPATVSLGKDMKLLVKLEGESEFKESGWYANNEDAGILITKEYQKFTAEIPYNTVAIRFYTGLGNGGCYRDVKNLKVYKDRILEAYLDENLKTKAEELDFGIVEPNASVSKTFYVKYVHAVLASGVTYDNGMRVVVEDGLGHYKVEYDQKNPCAEGIQAVKVTFTPTNCTTDYDATLTLLNGETVEVKLKGTLKRNPGTVSEIIWTGAVDTNWDNRANWKKADDNVLSAADVLDEQLQVNIPAGLAQYPVIPDVSTAKAFKEDRDKACDCAQVNAGDNASATMIAKTIVLEDGAALVGVETLYNPTTGVRRYHEVEKSFDGRRAEWLLVGTVVKPWTDNGSDARNILSEDFYLNGLPHVYMHEAVIGDNNQVTWQKTFADLDKEVPHDKAFAIFIANQYGPKLWTAKRYDYQYKTNYAETLDKPNQYTFKGHFFNESDVIHYENLEAGKAVMLCNTYPAPIDAKKLYNKGDGTIQYYDYTAKSFVAASTQEKPLILPQNGFVFTPNTGVNSITVDASYMVTSSNIQNRSIATEPTLCRIKATNSKKSVYSTISIGYDEYKEDYADLSMDAPKLFAAETAALPDIYVKRYDAKWASVTVPDMTQPIPLGVSINADKQTFTIEMTGNNMPYEILLEDRTTATIYHLSAGEVCTVSDLAIGDYPGRFYLYGIPLAEEDDDIETNINTSLDNNGYIDIYTQSNTVIVSAPKDTQLQTITVSDMVGRSTTYSVNGQYAEICMPESKGIYIINVVGEAGIATKKIKM